MGLGGKIQQTLKLRKMSQTELASRLNIPVSTLNGYIQERYVPDCAKLKEIATILDVSADFLLGIGTKNVFNKGELAVMVKYRTLSEEKKRMALEYFKFLEVKK
ncbi:MAG: helix-turn-helix domain-containing protein [Oscillospiraceae bacterium]|nr:helix-turn-helix domain-containing protein [Oscillospiraceae bacterium]